MSLAISKWHTSLLYFYLWLHMIHTLLKPFRSIHFYSSSYSFALQSFWSKGCLIISSHTQICHTLRSKNKRDNDKYSNGVTFTNCNPSNTQFFKTISASTRQSRKISASSDCNELQKPSCRQSPKKIAVNPEKNSDNKHEIEDDDNFCLLPHQTSQTMNHGLEKKPFDMNKKAFLGD